MNEQDVMDRTERESDVRGGTAELANQLSGKPVQQQAEAANDGHAPLFPEAEGQQFRSQWQDIQAGFVDDPRTAVQHADELVATTIRRLAEGFAEERGKLEQSWSRGDNVSTEDLRQAFRRYRSFFDRLLTL